MSYLEYLGLKREPFSNAPVKQLYFDSPGHAHALKRLSYAARNNKGLALLLGEIGAGKSTLARRLLDSLPEDEFEAGLLVIIHSDITADWLVKRIAMQLGVEHPSGDKLTLIGQVHDRLVEIHESGRQAVILIDEAQMLDTREVMEEFRGLLNLELPEQKLLTFIFFGLPELEEHLKLDPPLHQRVAMKLRLQPLDASSTEAYIKYRLRLAGARRMHFSSEAVQAIHQATQGTPRLINTLCDNCLFEAFMAGTPVVGQRLVRRCALELGLIEATPFRAPTAAPVIPQTQAVPPVTDPKPLDLAQLDRFLSGTDDS